MEAQSNFKFGIQLGNKNLEPLLLITIKERMVLFSFMTLLIDSHSTIFSFG